MKRTRSFLVYLALTGLALVIIGIPAGAAPAAPKTETDVLSPGAVSPLPEAIPLTLAADLKQKDPFGLEDDFSDPVAPETGKNTIEEEGFDDPDFNDDPSIGESVEDGLGDDFEDPPGGAVPPESMAGQPGSHDLNSGTGGVSGPEPPLTLTGSLSLASVFNIAHSSPGPGETDWQGLSRLKTELQLETDIRLSTFWKVHGELAASWDAAYTLNGRNGYERDLLRANETDMDIRELYVRGRLTDSLDITIGRQRVVWGKSDNIRVTDILNPLDLREPGMTDIEDLRLPLFMTRLDYYVGAWNISGIAIHEQRFNWLPPFGSDFCPTPLPYPPEEKPDDTLSDTGFALAVKGTFSGWDASVYAADYYDRMPHTDIRMSGIVPDISLRHAHLRMIGADLNIALGNWLLKSEAARFSSVRFSDTLSSTPPFFRLTNKGYSTIHFLAGFDYMGFTNTTVSIEGLNIHVMGHDRSLDNAGVDPDSFQSAVRVSRTFFNERLTLTLLCLLYGEKSQGGAISRLTGEYELTDALLVTAGIVGYNSGTRQAFQTIGDNDRIFLEFEYSF